MNYFKNFVSEQKFLAEIIELVDKNSHKSLSYEKHLRL